MQEGKNQAHPVEVAQEFMKRADMKGGEVEAYAQTFNWLNQIMTGELQVVTAKDLKASQDKQKELETEIKELHTELDDAYARLGVVRGEVERDPEPEQEGDDEITSEELEDVESEVSD